MRRFFLLKREQGAMTAALKEQGQSLILVPFSLFLDINYPNCEM